MNERWKRDEMADTDVWYLDRHSKVYGYVYQYPGSTQYNWQAVRGDYRLSDVVNGCDAAIAACEAALAVPIEEFDRRVLADLMRELRDVEKRILKLAPATPLLIGYHSGFEDGAEHIKRQIADTLYSEMPIERKAA